MKVVLFTRFDALGASSRMRMLQYIPCFKEAGFSIKVNHFFDDAYLKKKYSGKKVGLLAVLKCYLRRVRDIISLKGHDLVWVEKELFPYVPYFVERLFFKKLRKKVVILDYDDAVFHDYDQGNGLKRRLLGKKIAELMHDATMVFVGNSYLEAYAKQAEAKKIIKIPTCIDLKKYPEADSSLNSNQPQVEEELVVGWIGTPMTQHYLQEILPVLADFRGACSLRLIAIGLQELSYPGLTIECIPWTQESEVSSIMRCDIGIMPLDDTPWSRGKCGYKLIQYMACGLPVIASPVGVNVDIVSEGKNGYLAATPEAWLRALADLSDVSKRHTMALHGRTLVEREYSTQAVGPKIIKLFKEAAACVA